MGATLKFIYATEVQILALTPSSNKWVDRAFYYPADKSYFYQALDGVMKKYSGDATEMGVGVRLNGKVMGVVKTFIEEDETLEIPAKYDYNTFSLSNAGIINCEGKINILS